MQLFFKVFFRLPLPRFLLSIFQILLIMDERYLLKHLKQYCFQVSKANNVLKVTISWNPNAFWQHNLLEVFFEMEQCFWENGRTHLLVVLLLVIMLFILVGIVAVLTMGGLGQFVNQWYVRISNIPSNLFLLFAYDILVHRFRYATLTFTFRISI